MTAPHIPVLLDEVIAALAPAPGTVIVDATFGAGGYTRRLLDAGLAVMTPDSFGARSSISTSTMCAARARVSGSERARAAASMRELYRRPIIAQSGLAVPDRTA